jgi:hypothetical protein
VAHEKALISFLMVCAILVQNHQPPDTKLSPMPHPCYPCELFKGMALYISAM